MNNLGLAEVGEREELWVTFDSAITFNRRVEAFSNRASEIYEFTVRDKRHCNNIKYTRTLNISLTRSILEYATQVWNLTVSVKNKV